ncbi:MAG TPA: hypothetical protein VHV82_11040 [Sporichthyaceae bacterium]|jgi:nicotinamide mononucleotide (NMN) deamidase PncC|nr:hypothetical protein [Sporichthyaceae bacterium]
MRFGQLARAREDIAIAGSAIAGCPGGGSNQDPAGKVRTRCTETGRMFLSQQFQVAEFLAAAWIWSTA